MRTGATKSSRKELSELAEHPRKDPQDQAFGVASREDQELVDALEEQGVTEEELPDEPARQPRAAGKAEVAGSEN